MSSIQNPHSELVGALYRDHRGWLLAWLRRKVARLLGAEDLKAEKSRNYSLGLVAAAGAEHRFTAGAGHRVVEFAGAGCA